MMGLPTLLLRTETERPDGLADGTVQISGLQGDKIREFVLGGTIDELDAFAGPVGPHQLTNQFAAVHRRPAPRPLSSWVPRKPITTLFLRILFIYLASLNSS